MKSLTCLAVSLHAFHCADIDQYDGRRASRIMKFFNGLLASTSRFSTLAAHIGFRTHLWKGFPLDAMTNIGAGRLRGSVGDGKDHDSFDAELLALAGWRFEAGPVYALLQPVGIGAVVYRSNPWAIVGEGRRTSEPSIFVGNVLLGMQ